MDKQNVAVIKKADPHLRILIAQLILSAVLLLAVFVFKSFFTAGFNSFKTEYNSRFNKTAVEVFVPTIAQKPKTYENVSSSAKTVNNVSSLAPYAVTAMAPYNETVFTVPLKNYVKTSSFGERIDPINGNNAVHKGIDLAAGEGTPIYASANGKVVTATKSSTYGNYIVIEHNGTYKTLYAHCGKLLKNVGETVNTGDKIALVGSTGRSTGPHLHFEVIKNDNKVNPEEYIKLDEN